MKYMGWSELDLKAAEYDTVDEILCIMEAESKATRDRHKGLGVGAEGNGQGPGPGQGLAMEGMSDGKTEPEWREPTLEQKVMHVKSVKADFKRRYPKMFGNVR